MSTDSQKAEKHPRCILNRTNLCGQQKNSPAAFLQRGYLHVSNRMSVQSVSAL